MEGIMRGLYNEISSISTVSEYQSITTKYIEKLKENGLSEIANEIRHLAEFHENKFSKESTCENMRQSQQRVLSYIENHIYFGDQIQKNVGTLIAKKIMENFHLFCKSLYKDPIHGKCSDAIKNNLRNIEIFNEYDLQKLMYPLIRTIFPDARLEKSEDSGHHTIREDIVIDSQDIVIELKCSRTSMNERSLSEEIASDILHYSNKYVFFYIYDKENVVKNPTVFKYTYEHKKVEQKEIYVEIFQPIEL